MIRRELDIRGLICPITWARVRRALNELAPGDTLHVVLDHRPALPDIRRNAADLGHDVEAVVERDGFWELDVVVGAPDA